ncbi:MAG: tRNA(Ile)-lysidine synthase [Actinomycetota bacterium]|nr:tRNA(Ile)-lysidine synthase [Actinomycetota bacterium]
MAGAGRHPDPLTAAGRPPAADGLFAGLEAPVVVACSGGPDSLALLALAADAGLAPVAVHVDHGARAGSAAEADVVAGFAERLRTGFAAETVAVPRGPNFEARARDARYGALERARERLGATAVLVGHSRDDQAETVLLNVLRGAGVSGLAGMPVRRGTIVRPLLDVPRADLAAVCARLGLCPLDDPMNADPAHRRVWLRREVIPALEAGAARDLRAVLARQASVARADSELLDHLAAELLTRAGGSAAELLGTAGAGGSGRVEARAAGLDVAVLAEAPEALARRAVRLWLGPPPPPSAHVETVLAVARGEQRSADLPDGVRVSRAGGRLHRRLDRYGGQVATNVQTILVELPGEASGFGVELVAWVERAAPVRWPDGRWTAVVDADLAGDRAVLRAAGRGERFVPLGLAGHKLVSEALAEAGVPAGDRAGHPVLAGPDGSPLWVLGYRIDDRVRVSPGTRRFLWLTVEAGRGRG